MDITKGGAKTKFEELCEITIGLLCKEYNLTIKESKVIEKAIKQTIIECFKDWTLKKSQKEIICDRLKSHLPVKFHRIGHEDEFPHSSLKFLNDLTKSTKECTYRIMRKLYEYIGDNNVDYVVYNPNIYTDYELFD
jgi:hypothetical protein